MFIINNGKTLPLWDSFQDFPPDKFSGSDVIYSKISLFLKILKLLIYVFVFLLILSSAVISRISYLLMLTFISKETFVPYCDIKYGNRELYINIPQVQKIAWTWALIIAFSIPELLTILRSLRFCLFKEVKSQTWLEICLVSSMEILHVVGLGVLTFFIFPEINSINVLMILNCVSFVPAFSEAFFAKHHKKKRIFGSLISFTALIFQATAFFNPLNLVGWSTSFQSILATSLILVSVKWTENYLCGLNCIAHSDNIQRAKSRYRVYLFLSPIKVIIFMIVAFTSDKRNFAVTTTDFFDGFKSQILTINQVKYTTNRMRPPVFTDKYNMSLHQQLSIQSGFETILYTMLTQIISSYMCYVLAKFACKVKIQLFSFSLPLSLVGPTSIAIVMSLSLRKDNVCSLNFPGYLTLKITKASNSLKTEIWIWILWWLSQLWVTFHIWFPKNDKNAATEKLFNSPFYCGFLIDQCITMNRRRDNENRTVKTASPAKSFSEGFQSDNIPQLVVCATMWHETQEEMMEFIKSILRLDEDQCARRMSKIHIINGKEDSEYYDLETNIFFDDAFVLDEDFCENEKNPPLNEHVKLFIRCIEKAAFNVYGVNISIKPPLKIETPYGGRLVWALPGRSCMVAHLKNKSKIRHKKRWSQVMYMYYIMGFRIMELHHVSLIRKAIIADNTFILALDGDIDFKPQAVQLLIDRMKAVDGLGAACGRIHPVGLGPMIWYQIFEYAIGHWLQKSTEHVIGCVLCSPGCFSLFRGSALMQNGVIKRYAKLSEEAMEFVQYDQGEDRWLCTLLLKQGLRVEYSAAADAYTHAPESFNEFYNQRRRWIPSTIANIFDLLSNSQEIIKKNTSISTPYICYQAMLVSGTILAPGTIFLMMIGAFVAVFGIDIWISFLWNFFPLLLFVLSCLYLEQKYQLWLAFVISSAYCLIMLAVLVGVTIQIIEDGLYSPSSFFFILLFAQIIIAGLIHPHEAFALICIFIYYVTIPSMYMLLLIYSVFNINDVSWGTRETIEKGASGQNRSKTYLPGWTNDPLLEDSKIGELPIKEKQFWKDLIKSYLKPIIYTEQKKATIAQSLYKTRNMLAFAFIMINATFVLIVLLFQLKKDYFHLKWPINTTDFISYDEIHLQVYIYRNYKKLDPIGLCFVIFFGVILIIQFIAMLFHRFATISQLLATTKLDCFQRSISISDEDAAQEIRGNAVHIAKQLQMPRRPEEKKFLDSQDIDLQSYNNHRPTVVALYENSNKFHCEDYSDLPTNFEERFYGPGNINVKNISLSRKSIILLNKNRAKRNIL